MKRPMKTADDRLPENHDAPHTRRILDAGAIALLVGVILDQATKWLFLTHVMNPPRVIPVTSFFNFVLVYNRGVSFGMFGTGSIAEAGPWLLTAVTSAIVVVLIVWMVRSSDRWETVALGSIAGGAIGNIVDRVRQGAVTDFLDFYVGNWHWPAFNLADVFISCGVTLLLVRSFAVRS